MSTWLEKMNAKFKSVHEAKKMDPVDKEALKKAFAARKDKDIDNDGDVDSSDKYLHNRRKTISKATKGKETETQIDEISNKKLTSYAKASYNDVLKRRANRTPGQGDESDPKIGQRLKMNALAHKKGAFKKEEVELDEGAYVGGAPHTWPQYIGGINSKQAKAVKKHLTDKGHAFDDHSHGERNKKADTHYISMKTKEGHAELQKAKAKHKVDSSEERRKNLAYRGIKEAAIAPATHKGYQDPMDKGLSPSAKVELRRTTDAPSDAFDANKVIAKTFKDMRASLKNRKLRKGDQDTGDRAPVKNDGK